MARTWRVRSAGLALGMSVTGVALLCLVGTLAKVAGKHPPDYHFWFLTGDAPAFLAAELPSYAEGPVWRVELTSPRWAPPKR